MQKIIQCFQIFFLAALIKSLDLKQFRNDICLLTLFHGINFLENNGLDIITQHSSFQVHFVLGLVLCGNLGQDNILEIIKYFSANYFCHFFKVDKIRSRQMFEEDIGCLRNIVIII